jgi:hypothetical protein
MLVAILTLVASCAALVSGIASKLTLKKNRPNKEVKKVIA